MAKKEDTALAVTLPRALTARGFDSVQAVLKTNLGASGGLTMSDLTKIPMPAGGGTAFAVPQSDGEEKNYDEIEGVVVAFADGKAFWKVSLDESGGGTPPDCRSGDMVQGIGDPGILCSECPNNEFGSAEKGEGKACKDLRVLYILTENSLLPKVIVVPPTSLKSVRKTFIGLATDHELPYYGTILKFSLAKEVSKGGIKYSKLVVKKGETLNDAAYSAAKAYNKMFEPMVNGLAVDVLADKPTDAVDSEA